jgi:hypothetical protein
VAAKKFKFNVLFFGGVKVALLPPLVFYFNQVLVKVAK